MKSLKEKLSDVNAELKRLEGEKAAIYRASLDAPLSEKVCADGLAGFLGEAPRGSRYPMSVTGFAQTDDKTFEDDKHWLYPEDKVGVVPGAWVAVRPCDDAKTYLGVFLGNAATGICANYHPESGLLNVGLGLYNPAMWVPALRRVVFGKESWWERLKKPEDLRDITDADVEDVWYVKAMRELSKESTVVETKGEG